MRQIWFSVAIGSLLALGACDVVRVPGDGREAPVKIPEGAPGPPPPETSVTDPYNDGTPEPIVPIDAEEPEAPTEPEGDGEIAEPVTPDPDPTPEIPGEDAEPEPEIPPVETEPAPEPEPEPLPIKFQYYAPGELFPGSGIGNRSDAVYAPDMIFPIAEAPTYLNTQVWGYGGAMGPGGDGQCDARNYQYPWQDNFCETRSSTKRATLCTEAKVHQGQDLRAGDRQGCLDMVRGRPAKPTSYKIVAAENGVIAYIGRFYVQLRGTESGNIYNYVHINMDALQVSVGDTVSGGQHLGYLSDDFGGTPTTYHLHFEIKAPLEGQGITHVPPYMSLVRAYERRENGRGEMITPDTFVAASVPILPEGFVIPE